MRAMGRAEHVPAAYEYRCPWPHHPEGCGRHLAQALERAIIEAGADTVAAFIAEPVAGATLGAAVPPDDYWPEVAEVCRRHGVLLIADEVMTGFGRTGAWFGSDHWGVRPDVLLTAKGIASGMPLAAMAARALLMESWGAGHHGSTYGGNPVACAAALATIELLEGGLVANAEVRGRQAMAGLPPLMARHHDLIHDVRGKGLMIGIEFATADQAEEIQWACFERGLLVLEAGTSSIRLAPPLVVSEAEMATALRIFGEALDVVATAPDRIRREAEAAGALSEPEAGG